MEDILSRLDVEINSLVPCFPLVKNDYIENWDVSIFKDIKQLISPNVMKNLEICVKNAYKYSEIWHVFKLGSSFF